MNFIMFMDIEWSGEGVPSSFKRSSVAFLYIVWISNWYFELSVNIEDKKFIKIPKGLVCIFPLIIACIILGTVRNPCAGWILDIECWKRTSYLHIHQNNYRIVTNYILYKSKNKARHTRFNTPLYDSLV